MAMSGLARGIVVVERHATNNSCRSSSIIRHIASSSAGGGGSSHRRAPSNSFLVPEAYRRRNNDERNENVRGSRSRRRGEQRGSKEPRWSNSSGGVSGSSSSSSSSGGRAGGSFSPRRTSGGSSTGRGGPSLLTSVYQINARISSEKGGRGGGGSSLGGRHARGTPSSRRLRRVIEDQHHRSSRPTSSPGTSLTTTPKTNDGQSTLSRGYADILRDVEGGGRGKRKPLDMDGLRRLEDKVGIAMAEYVGLLNGLSSFVAGGENNKESISSRGRELLVLSDLHDAESSYRRIVSDFASLITGWSDLAESASSNSSSWKDDNNVENESDGGSADASTTSAIRERWKHNDRQTKYEDAMSRAVRHLESYEGLHRQRLDVVLAAKRRENDDDGMSSKDLGVIGKITSLLGGIFSSSSTNSIDDSFNKSWERPDNKKSSSTKGKDGTSPDFCDTVLSQMNGDLRLITLLYEHILLANHSAYSLGEKMKEGSVQRSNRLLNRWISSYCSASSGLLADKRDDPTLDDYGSSGIRRIFHVVIRLNTDLHTIDGMKDAEEWLQRMNDLAKSSSMMHRLAQDVDAHNLVLLGYCNLCKSLYHDPWSSKLSHKDAVDAKKMEMEKRRFVVNGAVRMLHVLAEQMEPKVMSLNLALNAIAKGGAGFPDDSICSTTNKLIFKLLGEEEYRNLNEPHAAPPDFDEYDINNVTRPIASNLRPNLDTYHWLVDIYSTSNNIVYTKRASAILNKMIRIRAEQDSAYLTGDGRSSFAPSTGTHNKVLHALTTEMEAAIFVDAKARENTAREATKLLDSMVLHGSSMPSPITYLLLMRLWQNTQSSEAGEYAEEILSRMEILGMYQNDMRVLSNAYFQVIDCWYTAARAGRSSAADRAFR